ncbi:MAG: response regulator [Proteobacteria bacterium]|nr:response regulator [Pseudomonadota bacterium]MBU1688556.1 response regulator [Pseudomonadota bacterium]
MGKKKRLQNILIVDDEETILWSLNEYLVNDQLSAKVITASSGEDALATLARLRIDLVITDIKMPGISGIELLMEIKNRFPQIPVIVMTAFPSSEFKREVTLKGGLSFVEKPFDINDLRHTVINALREENQFRGTLTGISLGDVIQIKCMSGVTAALRVSEGDRQGIIFFQKGEIIHALCDQLDGEEAFYEIMSFSHGILDTVQLTEMPEQTISMPCTALLMEGSRRQDEKQHREQNDDNPEQTKAPEETEKSAGIEKNDQTDGSLLGTALERFKTIKGYQASVIMESTGTIITRDDPAAGYDLDLVGTTINDFFRSAHSRLEKTPMGGCREIVLQLTKETILLRCQSPEKETSYLVIALFSTLANLAMAKISIKKVVEDLAK